MVHVAGTNGKGSVVAMLTATQRAAGRTVNAYVSPHLLRFNERMLIDGQPIGDGPLVAALDAAEQANAGESITFFEITTTAAFLAFNARPAEITILETGLGGRLDATNVVKEPALTVITPIGLDHCDRLGSTLAEIAAEKAGILKRGVPVVVGQQEPEAASVVLERARQLHASSYCHGVAWQVQRSRGQARYVDATGARVRLPTALAGFHQEENAGIAAACAAVVPEFAVDEGTQVSALERIHWPGRLQRLQEGRLAALAAPGELWVDAGHNAAAARVLAGWGRNGPPLRLIVGLQKSKDPASFFRPFCGVAGSVTAVSLGPGSVSWSPEALAAVARGIGLCAAPSSSLEAAVRSSSRSGPPGRVLVAGSFLLIGQALGHSGVDACGIRL